MSEAAIPAPIARERFWDGFGRDLFRYFVYQPSAGMLRKLFFCLTVRRTGSLWFAIGFHAVWDYAESFIYSVPDSGIMVPGHLMDSTFGGPRWLTGGHIGPEGSVFVFPLLGLLCLAFARLNKEARFPGPAAPGC